MVSVLWTLNVRVAVKKERSSQEKLHQFLTWQLRRISYRTPARSQALKSAQVPVPPNYPNKRLRFLYSCVACLAAFPQKEVQVDHIEPVVPVTGFTTWDDFITRLFCGPEGLQIMCLKCHNVKSQIENAQRRAA